MREPFTLYSKGWKINLYRKLYESWCELSYDVDLFDKVEHVWHFIY